MSAIPVLSPAGVPDPGAAISQASRKSRAAGTEAAGFPSLLELALRPQPQPHPVQAEDRTQPLAAEVGTQPVEAEDAAQPLEAEEPTQPERAEGESGPEVSAAGSRAAAPPSGGATAAGPSLRPAAPSGASGDPRRVERRLDLVAAELGTRVERVIERMREEYGHRVEVVETLRHQGRQDFLFEQGRSRPGPVVTWTRASNHTVGRAVDVVIDGTYDNPAAYARLARIAADEGLRTLGSRDPGHLELPDGEGGRSRILGVRRGHAVPAQPLEGGVARVAAVASATPPAVAPVAALAAPAAAVVAQIAAPGRSGARSDGGGRKDGGEPAMMPAPAVEPGDAVRAAPVFAVTEALRSAFAGDPGMAGTGATAAARIAHLLDLQSSQPLRPMSHVLLRLDGPDGADRIRLGVHGVALDAVISLRDAGAVEHLNSRLGELQQALQQRGLEAESLRVRSLGPRERVELTQAAAAALEPETQRSAAARLAADAAARDRHAPSRGDEPPHGSPDPRHRSRREPKGEHHA